MSDNPKKKKLDGKRISQQPWEQAYQRKKNSRKKKKVIDPFTDRMRQRIKDPDENYLLQLAYHRSQGMIVNQPKLELALVKMERAVLQNPVRTKGPISFCQEWEEKGKPIFNMVLVLFGFSAKTKTVIRRIMRGIDGVCSAESEP